jgi:hypothetical protein
MNRLNAAKLLVSGLMTLVVFVVIEYIWEFFLGDVLFPRMAELREHEYLIVGDWDGRNHMLNLLVAFINCTLMIWLYAALRPMFGVGPRNALITSGFALAFILAFMVNNVNLGYVPARLFAMDAINLLLEIPLAMLAGAYIYEYS